MMGILIGKREVLTSNIAGRREECQPIRGPEHASLTNQRAALASSSLVIQGWG